MKQDNSKHTAGFTLIEMLLVAVIVGMLVYMAFGYMQQKTLEARFERTTTQMQQILNAGLAYYVTNGTWPSSLACLQGQGGASCTTPYLINPMSNPWGGQNYTVVSTASNLYVYTPVVTNSRATASAYAQVMSGKLPLAYTTRDVSRTPPDQRACNSTTCYVVASVNVPGQNLNNASAVNFAGTYNHGGCVPAPECPVDPRSGNTMTPQIFVVPVSVSGLYDEGSLKAYPITSFTAYAEGNNPLNTTPPRCQGSSSETPSTDCTQRVSGAPANAYWRVCLKIETSKGDLSDRSGLWGNFVKVIAFTRCSISGEPAGSTFNVFSN